MGALSSFLSNLVPRTFTLAWPQPRVKALGTRLVFELSALKAKIKGVFSRSYYCYGNLLCHENDTNVFTSDWAVF